MKNAKVEAFRNKVEEVYLKNMATLTSEISKRIKDFNELPLIIFSNDDPYEGETKNMIFLTLNDHYRGNSSNWQSVGSLGRPHEDMDDRGYIKGIAVDLDNYIKLRNIVGDFTYNNSLYLYRPSFRKSAHSEAYQGECDKISSDFHLKMDTAMENAKKEIARETVKLTGMALCNFIRAI